MGIEMGKFVLTILGKAGPINIDVGINGHNDDLEEFSDDFVIGKETAIDIQDCLSFLNKLEKYALNPAFDNGRSYFFEGIRELEDGSYRISWGS